jgi:hypothetical protein
MPKSFILLALLLLTSCGAFPEPVVAASLADLASVAVFQRGLGDLLVSGATGRDCSIVRLDRGQSYCRPVDPPPQPPPYCTRTLGTAECWISPFPPPSLQAGAADGPSTLTPAQEAYRTRRWPGW